MSRAWFAYNGAVAGELTATNYFYISNFPQCTTTGVNICGILGLYVPIVYGNHPAPFSDNLEKYINTSIANSIAAPPIPNKPYVYVRQ